MPKTISKRKEWKALDLILRGHSLDDVSGRTETSKGWVVGLWQRVCGGAYPELVGPGETAEGLREVAVAVRRQGVQVEEALLGVRVIRQLAALGVTPESLAKAAQRIETMATPDFPKEGFGPAVLRLLELERREGRTAAQIVSDLESRAARRADSEARIAEASTELRRIKAKTRDALVEAKVTRRDIDRVGALAEALREHNLDLGKVERMPAFLGECARLGYDADRVQDLAGLDEALRGAGLDVPRAVELLRLCDALVTMGYTATGFQELARLWEQSGMEPAEGIAVVHEASVQSRTLEALLATRKAEIAGGEEALGRLKAEIEDARGDQRNVERQVRAAQETLETLQTQIEEEKGVLDGLGQQTSAAEWRLARAVDSEDLVEGIQNFVEERRAMAMEAERTRIADERESAILRGQFDAMRDELALVSGMISLLYTKRDQLPHRFSETLIELAALLQGRVPPGSFLDRLGFKGEGPHLEARVLSIRTELQIDILRAVNRMIGGELVWRSSLVAAQLECGEWRAALATRDKKLVEEHARVRTLERRVGELERELRSAKIQLEFK